MYSSSKFGILHMNWGIKIMIQIIKVMDIIRILDIVTVCCYLWFKKFVFKGLILIVIVMKTKKTLSTSINTKLYLWITTNCGKFFKRWKYQITWTASWEICMQDKKQQLELDMEQQTHFKLRKEYIKAVYCHPAYLTSMQSTSCEMLGWMKQKLESRLPVEISITSDRQMTPPLWQKAKKN